MNLLSRFTNATRFRDYNDFYNHFQLIVPDNYNFAYDVVDEIARQEPEKRALVWCNTEGEEHTFWRSRGFGDLRPDGDGVVMERLT